MFERTAISRLPEAAIRQDLQQLREADRLTPELVFRDPYLLDFLGLKDTYSEHDLEAAILRELERFLLELGTDFTFVARQKRMTMAKGLGQGVGVLVSKRSSKSTMEAATVLGNGLAKALPPSPNKMPSLVDPDFC
jgi:hypothetical protein